MLLPACILITLILSGFVSAFAAEPIPITISNRMDKIIFDGKWSFEFEWKASSLNTYSYDNETQIVLRSAHQGNFVYVFLDAITDSHLDTLDDYAFICFDTKNNKTVTSNSDDYCFMARLDEKNGFTYQGNATSDHFQKISNPANFIGMSTVSDNNDRYTTMPHPSYEFKIPTDLIGRENVYGFYFLVHDAHSNKSYIYPENIKLDNLTDIPSPSVWGTMYSPDKSLPEFDVPILSLFLSIIVIMYMSQVKMKNNKIIHTIK